MRLARGASLIVLALSLAGCRDWNERKAHFDTYTAYQAGPYADSGHLPSSLLPRSARNIDFTYNIDTTEVDVRFDFDQAEAERVIAPFRSPDQVQLHELEKAGQLPKSNVASPKFVRCAGRGVEFLQITGMAKAHYWTSSDPQVRKTACTTVTNAGGPLI